MGNRRESAGQLTEAGTNRIRIVDERRGSDFPRDLVERDFTRQEQPLRVARKSRVLEEGGAELRQYALAQTASVTLGASHQRHFAGALGERNSSSGSTRTV
ncbi:MAG TPA: hypothetical protein VFV24_09370, partial [Candidatus Eisenbacteria bacterium]|nr:hypothetical protein [Candidatus Eisenbacteria bacterium]